MMIDAMKEKPREENPTSVLDEDMVVATALVLLVAGYETTANTLSFLLLELAKNTDIQESLRIEVDEAYGSDSNNSQGGLTYSTVQGMTYLDMVVHEALRLYPAAATAIVRECASRTTNCPKPRLRSRKVRS